MNRKDKIKLLQAIKEGKIAAESLQPPQVYIFTEKSTNPGVYEYKGKEYNETEYQEFCNRIKNRNKRAMILHEGKTYTEDVIILARCANRENNEITTK